MSKNQSEPFTPKRVIVNVSYGIIEKVVTDSKELVGTEVVFIDEKPLPSDIMKVASIKKATPKILSMAKQLLDKYDSNDPEHVIPSSFRKLPEIYEEMDFLRDKIWYYEHQRMREGISNGNIKLIDKTSHYDPDKTVDRQIWKQAREHALSIEEKYGKKKLLVENWDEYVSIQGKLAGIYWVTGEDDWE